MTPRAARAALAALAPILLLALAGCGRAPAANSDRLELEAPRWWFSVLPVRLTAVPKGALAELKPSLTVAVNLNVAGNPKLAGGKTAIWIGGDHFSTGTNEVVVKTGLERAAAQVQIVSIVWLLAPLAITAAIVVELVRRKRASARKLDRATA